MEKDVLNEFLPEEKTPSDPIEEEEEEIVLVDTTPIIKSPKDMLLETAQRLASSRVDRVMAEKGLKQEYERKVGSSVNNSNYFTGGLVNETIKDDDD